MTRSSSEPSIVQFLRKRDYAFVRKLGQGGCGETVLLFDESIGLQIVCKKYSPQAEELRDELFRNFMTEIRLLHEIHHPNLVRVFNHYLYPDKKAGYILMEYVEGLSIENAFRDNPQSGGELFRQAVEGFAYLESIGILHRDIRPANILVRSDGVLKVIDLGFGKRITKSSDFDKSISLNWWCEPPREFASGRYDFGTEVYFLGKLFERLLHENSLGEFPHAKVLGRMCKNDPSERLSTFSAVRSALLSVDDPVAEFAARELEVYRNFADRLHGLVKEVDAGMKYVQEADVIKARLEQAYRDCMLEEEIVNVAPTVRAFLIGTFWYNRRASFPVDVLKDFVLLFRQSTVEKQKILIANLHGRLDTLPRKAQKSDDFEDDIPF